LSDADNANVQLLFGVSSSLGKKLAFTFREVVKTFESNMGILQHHNKSTSRKTISVMWGGRLKYLTSYD